MSDRKTCVLVSDDHLFRNRIRPILQELGFEVLEAAGNKQGAKCLGQEPALAVFAESESEGGEDVRDLRHCFGAYRPKLIYAEASPCRRPGGEMGKIASVVVLKRDFNNFEIVEGTLLGLNLV